MTNPKHSLRATLGSGAALITLILLPGTLPSGYWLYDGPVPAAVITAATTWVPVLLACTVWALLLVQTLAPARRRRGSTDERS